MSRNDSEISGSQNHCLSISNVEFPKFNGDDPRGWIRKCQWVKGKAYGHEVQILIDGGSTHYFLDEDATIKLGCHLEQTIPMVLPYADLNTRRMSHGVGGDWLRHYSPMEYDYKAMTVTVSKNAEKWGFKALSQKKAELHLISASSISKLVNEGAYGYSYAQKGEIKTIVKGMLQDGMIRPSQSSFGSPVLLVKKKDGSWRMCVDYRSEGFLGLTGYYRKFVKGYRMISKPPTELLKKDNFEWTDDATNAFESLKQAMISAPVLTLPNFSKSFVVEANACDKGIGAVLMQEHRHIAYLSNALSLRNQGLSIYEKEFLAILQAVHKWKHYLIGYHFIIKTDHQHYEVQYKKGKDNIVVDALSRREHGECANITVIIPNWVTNIQKNYEQDDELLTIMQAKTVKDTSFPAYTLQGGFFREESTNLRGEEYCSKGKNISSLHESTIGGHSGLDFYFHGHYRRIAKVGRERLHNGGGRPSHKVCLFHALTHPFTTEVVARIFMDQVYRLHGLPVNIISDRDKIFTGIFWKELFRLLGTILNLIDSISPTNRWANRMGEPVRRKLLAMHVSPQAKLVEQMAVTG
ncbi:Retrovirus-related Pol polyprotein from transposon.6 [Sesamum angolense]|uniref:Retrovirus-related Pol polyprotein from transposon.6 n=1 Tax=Sesamum angolense TaxID=2727404 RepID=A0AAE1X817_9LAMI|nr:Retrovirus-related Pol polyprotein from transposon.6 [Sesamum angolense]